MKFTLVAITGFIGFSIAQDAGSLPSCAQSCASQQFSGGSYANCGTDPKCICANKNLLTILSCCLASVCSTADQQSAIAFAQQICVANGVTVPSVVSCDTAALASATATTATAGTTTATTSGAVSSGVTTTTTSAATATGSSTGTGTGSTSTGTTAASVKSTATATSSGATSSAWAPKPTAGLVGAEILGGLVAGWALL